jgi:hypothetical protein
MGDKENMKGVFAKSKVLEKEIEDNLKGLRYD